METGKIKKYFTDKGYGYIEVDGCSNDYKFNRESFIKAGYLPTINDVVNFETKIGHEKKAFNITPAISGSVTGEKTPIKKSSAKNIFPYSFIEREVGIKTAPPEHDHLGVDSLDIAFEVEWTTKTPTALAPCEDPGKSDSAINIDGENTGFSKRWLQLDNKLAISPFTVKGAIANGVANILGGCYRVVDQTEGHKANATAEGFPYTGVWKRYRVAMDESKAGIIKEIDPVSGVVKVEAVNEYYYDEKNLPVSLHPGEQSTAATYTDRHKKFIRSLSSGNEKLTYYGPYRFGMNLTLKPGDLGKKHYHRFYSSTQKTIEGKVPRLNFASPQETKKGSYAGIFCKGEQATLQNTRNPCGDLLGEPWYQDLRQLKPGDWCYYTSFQNSITGIGKNFQFKTFFHLSEDCVPQNQRICADSATLCPRCSLFGSTAANEKSVGYAGRFKAAALTADFKVVESTFKTKVPTDKEDINVEFSNWKNSAGDEIVKQVLLPIMGPPKPSKRDANGYFDKNGGMIKGAKKYRHAELDFDHELPQMVSKNARENKEYAYRLSGVAPVCKDNISFAGTLGAESCSTDEFTALIVLLDQRVADNVFKLGLGKHLGMGSISSKINKLWYRDAQSYTWQTLEIPTDYSRAELIALMEKAVPDLTNTINRLKLLKKVNAWNEPAASLSYPAAGNKYWSEAKVETQR